MKIGKFISLILLVLVFTGIVSCSKEEERFSVCGTWNLYYGEITLGLITFEPYSSEDYKSFGHGEITVYSEGREVSIPFSYRYNLDLPQAGKGRLELFTDKTAEDYPEISTLYLPLFPGDIFSFDAVNANFRFYTPDHTRSWTCTPWHPV